MVRALLMLTVGLLLAACAGGAPSLTPTDASPTSAHGGGMQLGKQMRHGRSDITLKVVRELPTPAASADGSRQAISPGDKLEVVVFNVKELNREVQVDAAGNISLPLIGIVRAAGKTARELERELTRRYGARYLQNPQIAVNVKESMGQRVTVNGEVKLPGIYPIAPHATLMQALALGRGFTPVADPQKVFVYRKIDGQQYVAQYDVEAIQAGRKRDPRVYGGDIIAVFPSSAKVAMENLKSVLGLASQAGRLAVIPLP